VLSDMREREREREREYVGEQHKKPLWERTWGLCNQGGSNLTSLIHPNLITNLGKMKIF
jgi:hypothetical protein